jgi:hypothetical protein
MADISVLADIDSVFIEVAKALYGDGIDARELWDISKGPDAADVHVNAAPQKKKDPHSNAARALVVGGAAEGLGTYRAGQAAYKAIKPAAAVEGAAKATGKLASTGGTAAKVGEFGLQAANLGIGLVAARKLSQDAKKNAGVAKGMPKLNFLRPVKRVMSTEDAAAHTAAMSGASKGGLRMIVGGTALAAAAVGHRMGRKSGIKAANTANIAKGTLVAGVRPINSGGASNGLGRHGRLIAGKTPAPQLQPVAKPLPKNNIVKSVTWTGVISKIDTDKRTVFGWCSLSKVDGQDVVDLQGDSIDIDEVEKSAYTYVLESRKGGDMHKRVSKGSEVHHTADLIESFVVTPEKLEQMGLASNALPLGWWIGMKVNDDEQWGEVKAGRRTGFSIHGTGSRTEVAA